MYPSIYDIHFIVLFSLQTLTTLAFPEGISAVVGPNGCGKSNIVDALRWVMGEQSVKLLRGKSMEDIIFSGTEKRPPLNMAEVALTLINDDGDIPEQYREFSEIMVARRLFRSGESAYFINKQPCRLKDIQDLLMGSGVGSRTYSVIEQGRITTLIDAGPEERRYFVEEAAGTTRYKSRKNEALRKIERTHQNLQRINDVIIEIKRQMNSLKRQARKAERYKAYQEQIQHLEVGLATHRYKAICTEISETDALLQSLKDTDLKHGSELAKLDAAIEGIKQERTAKHEEMSGHKATRYQLQRTVDKLERDLEHGTKDLERLNTETRQLKTEIKEIGEKDNQTDLECRNIDERALALQQEIDRTEENVKQEEPTKHTLKNRLAELNQILETKKTELMDLVTRRAAYQNTLQNTSESKAALTRRIEHIRKEKRQTEAEIVRLEKGLTKANTALHDLKKNLEEISKNLKSSEKQFTEKREVLADQIRKVQTMEAEKQRIRSGHTALVKMDENYDWYKEGVRAIMRGSGSQDPDQTGIHGLVADVIEVQPSYEDAAEAALGEALQYVIVKDQEGGLAAIDYLRTQSAGRGAFIPIKGVRPVMKFLVGHVVIVKDMKEALSLWNRNGFSHSVVTHKGDRVSSQGILMGGSSDNGASGILTKKKEIRELGKQLSRLEAATAKEKSTQEQLEAEAIALETRIQETRLIERQKSQEEMDLDKALYRLGEELKHARHGLKVIDLEAQQNKGEKTDLDLEHSKYDEMLSELSKEIQTTESAVGQTGAEIKEASEGLESSDQKLVGLSLELTRLRAEYDNAQNTVRRLKTFQDERLREMSHLANQLKQKQLDGMTVQEQLGRDRDKIARLYDEIETADEALAEMEAQYQAIERMLEESDRAFSDVGSAQQQTLQKIQQLELKQTERRMQREHLVSRIRESYHLDIESSDHDDHPEAFSVEETDEALARLREKIMRIGDVNLAAIQEYETLEERYRFLTEQRDDLVDAVDALRRVIRKINRKSLRKFMRTFKAVNEKLQHVFPRLFEGGTAKLALTDPKRPLESGVSFLVHPPGKRLTRMSLLSGGEKALSAIALVFSLFLIKPASFSVFDEIDAPLDDVNTFRYNDMLREIGKESQIILITHNKQTMEVADAL
ncbi:MAG: AAA family ATPase, partial [Deltaproteobacteria bacterium]|nr:AAA family ATPase [Deltaproteobacteria bacterium]